MTLVVRGDLLPLFAIGDLGDRFLPWVATELFTTWFNNLGWLVCDKARTAHGLPQTAELMMELASKVDMLRLLPHLTAPGQLFADGCWTGGLRHPELAERVYLGEARSTATGGEPDSGDDVQGDGCMQEEHVGPTSTRHCAAVPANGGTTPCM